MRVYPSMRRKPANPDIAPASAPLRLCLAGPTAGLRMDDPSVTQWLHRAREGNAEALGHAYAAAYDDKVFKSVDSGDHWIASSVGLVGNGYGHLVVDPMTPNTLYVGGRFPGVSKSTNGGDNWVGADNGLPGHSAYSLEIDPTNSQTLASFSLIASAC